MNARVFIAVLAVLLSGCGLQPPDPTPYVTGCSNQPFSGPTSDKEKIVFFMSSALPDCRTGGLRLANYRHPQTTFGTGRYTFAAENEPLAPLLAKHAEDDWLAAIEAEVQKPENNGRLLVFIHGYRTDFEMAHRDAARVRELPDKTQPLVVLHWPSRYRTTDYLLDEASIAWAQDSIIDTLAHLATIADDITLVTHSMGARAGLDAVTALDARSDGRGENIRSVVLTSPDYDQHTALREGGTMDQLLRSNRRVLVYASNQDVPLRLSRTAHGYARLGSTNCEYSVVYARRSLGKDGNCHLTRPRPGLAMVDTGPAKVDDRLRHNDFLDSCHVRGDLAAFLDGADTSPYRKALSDGELEGFVIDPEVSVPGGPCE